MGAQVKLSERLAFRGNVDPKSYTAGSTTNSEAVDMEIYNQVCFRIELGVHGTTVFKLQESNDGGANWSDISGKSLTITSNNVQRFIDCRADELSEGYYLVRSNMYLSSASGLAASNATAGDPRYAAPSHESSVSDSA